MSTTIDERVVEMKFDNKNFETNVQTSMSTLEKLKKALRFDGAADGLEHINAAAGKVDMGGLSSAAEGITNKFSAMEQIAIGALRNIGSSAVEAGKKLIASLSTDQLSAGWEKYADKTTSVQTIMAATAKDFSDTGEQMEYVNDQLSKLNWFTDETSYNFVDMTSNIGKFTSSGVKLDTAVTAMEGIATWAAISGANAGEASRAMYNLSQALATGSVKLIDWKSIENANMATLEFKETAIETALALGTLERASDGTIQTLDGNTVSATNFNEALKDQWFTSEVLLQSLDKYGGFTDKLYNISQKTGLTASEILDAAESYKEGTLDLSEISEETGATISELTSWFDELGSKTLELGNKSFRAAQEAKTFQEALDSVKDAVSTGWLNTFEIVFGNYQEAKKLWTRVANELYDLFAGSAEARNELLSGWKEQGGRDALLSSVENAWNGLLSIIDTVKQAFREIFPPMTVERLVEITNRVKDLTENFKMGTATSENLKNTFKGLFAAIDIVGQVFSALFNGVKNLLGFVPGLNRGILRVTGSFGEWLVKLDETLKKNETFTKAINKVVTFLQGVGSKVRTIVTKIIDEIKWLFTDDSWVLQGDIINKKIDENIHALEKVKPIVQGIINFVKGIPGKISAIIDEIKWLFTDDSWVLQGDIINKKIDENIHALEKVKPIVQGIVKFVSNLFGNVVDFAKDLPNKINAAYNAVNGFIQGFSGLTIPDIFGKLKSGAEKAKNSFVTITESISQTEKSADDMGQKVSPLTAIFEGLKKIFDAVVKAFDKAKPVFKTIGESLGKMLSDAGDALDKWVDNFDFGKLAALISTGLLTAIGTGIAKFFLGIGDASQGVGGIVQSLEDIFGGFSDTLEAFQKNINAKTLSTIAHAVVELTAAIVVLSLLPSDKMAIAAVAISVLVGEMIGAMAVVGKMDTVMDTAKMNQLGKTLIKVSTAVLILSVAVKSLSDIPLLNTSDGSGLLTAIGAVTTMLAEIVGLSYLIKDKDFENTAKALVILSAGLFIMAQSIKSIAELSWDELKVGLLGFSVVLGGIIVATQFIDEKTTKVSLGLGLMALALHGVVKVVKVFAEMDINSLIVGMTAMAAALLVMALAANGMANPMVLEGAGAMVIMAAALLLLIPVIQTLGGMKIEEIGMALLGLVGVFTVLGVAGLVLGPVVPVITALATAIAILGVGMAAAGVGMLAFSTGLATLSVAGAAGITLLSAAILAIVALIPNILLAVGDGIVKLVKFFGDAAPVFKDAFVKIVTSMVQGFTETIPEVVKAAVTMIDELLKTIAEHLPSIIESGWQMVLALLHGIEDHIQEAVETFIGIITGIIDGIANKMDDMIESGINLILSFIEGLSKGIVDNAERARDAMRGLIESLIEAALIVLGIAKDKDEATEMVKTAENAISSFITGLWNKAKELFEAAVKVVTDAWDGIVNTVKDWIKAGEDLIGGLIDGITGAAKGAIDAVVGVATDIWDGITGFFGINSPSREFAKVGRYLDEGLAKGLNDYADEPMDATNSVGKGVLKSMSDAVSKVSDMMNSEMDMNPTIRPVLDLDNVVSGINNMDSMLSSKRSLDLASTANYDINRNSARRAQSSVFGESNDSANASTNNTITNNFNITGDNPKEIASEVSRILQSQLERRDASWA